MLWTAFVSNNRDTVNRCPCLTKRPSSELLLVFCGAKKAGQLKVKDFLLKQPPLFSICTYFCLALILPQKTALHTHSALKLLLEGKEALKGLNPRADGTRARMGPDRQDGQGKKANSKEVEVKRLPEEWLDIENMLMFLKNTRMTQSHHPFAVFLQKCCTFELFFLLYVLPSLCFLYWQQ